MITVNRNPSKTDLKVFQFVLLLFGGAGGAFSMWRLTNSSIAWSIWAVTGFLLGVYVSVPRVRRPLYVGWMYLFLPVGLVISYTMLATVYYLLIVPTGMVLRLVRGDSLGRSFDSDLESYWVNRGETRNLSDYFRQF